MYWTSTRRLELNSELGDVVAPEVAVPNGLQLFLNPFQFVLICFVLLYFLEVSMPVLIFGIIVLRLSFPGSGNLRLVRLWLLIYLYCIYGDRCLVRPDWVCQDWLDEAGRGVFTSATFFALD